MSRHTHECHFTWFEDEWLKERYQERAEENFQKSEDHAANNPDRANRNFYGYMLFKRSNFLDAKAQFELVLEEDGNDRVALANLMHLADVQGLQTLAESYRERLEQVPSKKDLANIKWNHAYCFTRLFLYERTVACYQEAISLSPESYPFHLYLAITLNRTAHIKRRKKDTKEAAFQCAREAKQALETVLELTREEELSLPHASLVYAHMGRALMVLIEPKEATVKEAHDFFKQSIDTCPNESNFKFYGKFLSCFFSRNLKEIEKGEAILLESIERNPTTYAYHQIANLLEKKLRILKRDLEKKKSLPVKKNIKKRKGRKKSNLDNANSKVISHIESQIESISGEIISALQESIEMEKSNYIVHIQLLGKMLERNEYETIVNHCMSYPRFTSKTTFVFFRTKALYHLGETNSVFNLLKPHVKEHDDLTPYQRRKILELIGQIYTDKTAAHQLEIAKWGIWCKHDLEKVNLSLSELLGNSPENQEYLCWKLRCAILADDREGIVQILERLTPYIDTLADFPDATALDIKAYIAEALSLTKHIPNEEKIHQLNTTALDVPAMTDLVTHLLLMPKCSLDGLVKARAWLQLTFYYSMFSLGDDVYYRYPAHWEMTVLLKLQLETHQEVLSNQLDEYYGVLAYLYLSIRAYALAKSAADQGRELSQSTENEAFELRFNEGVNQEKTQLYGDGPYKVMQWLRGHYFQYCVEAFNNKVNQETVHDIIVKSRKFLDQLFYQFIKTEFPDLVLKRAYFPCVPSGGGMIRDRLENYLTRSSRNPSLPFLGISNFLERFEQLFNFLLSIQPLHDDRHIWLAQLYALRNRTHGDVFGKLEEVEGETINTIEFAQSAFFYIQAVAAKFYCAAQGDEVSLTENMPALHPIFPCMNQLSEAAAANLRIVDYPDTLFAGQLENLHLGEDAAATIVVNAVS